MRFSRRWQRERAARADAEAAARAAVWYRVARWVMPGPQPLVPPWNWDTGEQVQPYRGFRAGRGRLRPDGTGYDEPTSPDREQWEEPPAADPILGDSDDEPWTGSAERST